MRAIYILIGILSLVLLTLQVHNIHGLAKLSVGDLEGDDLVEVE
jgi:hypothetical protein